MRTPVFFIALSLSLALGACSGESTTDSSDTQSNTTQSDASAQAGDSGSGQASGEDTSSGEEDWCFSSAECTGADEICTIDYGDCQGCADPAEICCGVCAPDPCANTSCGGDCFCPPGVMCAELPMACNSEGLCVALNNDLGCEEPEPYDACAELACGEECNPCAPGDEECAMMPGLPHFCDSEGQCSNNEPETLGCTTICMNSGECGETEVCTSAFGDCQTCEGGTEPVCCGVCVENPCNGQACGDPCSCPDGVPCNELPMTCNEKGECGLAGEAQCEPYLPCKDKGCGDDCNPCPPGDNSCETPGASPFYCNSEGSCIDEAPEELGCSQSCVVSNECGADEVCTTEFYACETCDGPGGADPVCCGQCVKNPCADKACGESCQCPEGTSCPEVPRACNEYGACVTADAPQCEPADPCKDQACGTPCGDDQLCDASGACVLSPNMPAEEWCASQTAGCQSSDECELGEYCTVSDGDCVACSEGSLLTVCCGTCEPFDPCKDKVCGAICGPCPSDQQDCIAPAVESYCTMEGECSESAGTCDM